MTANDSVGVVVRAAAGEQPAIRRECVATDRRGGVQREQLVAALDAQHADRRAVAQPGRAHLRAVVNRGRIEGDGVFAFTPVRNTGVVAPGLPTGQLTVSLDPYEQTSVGTLEIELGGTEAGVDHDVLAVAFDTATLAGTLHVRLVGGFEPEIGQEFTVLTASSVIGTFDEIIDQAGVTVAYTSDSVVLTYVGGVDPADVNGDGVVDFGDILALLAAWGPCPRNRACPEDIDADGEVSFADLIIVLAHWT